MMKHCLFVGVLGSTLSICASAQVTVPGVTLGGTSPVAIPVSAAEAAYHVAVQRTRGQDAVSFFQGRYPKDSMQAAVTAGAEQWIAQLRMRPIRGIQLDPYGAVSVDAHHDVDAQREVTTRLATPGLSVIDKAYTYLTAVLAFADPDVPARLPVAERYVVALDALGDAAAIQRFLAHRRLAGVYYLLGRAEDVTRHGLRAVSVLGATEFDDRRVMYQYAQFYSEVVDAMSGQPNAHERIAALNATLTTDATPSADLIARDSNFVWAGRGYRNQLQQMITVGMRVGTRGDDIVSNYWVNLSAVGAVSGPQTVSVADGKIHIVEMGHYTCPQCITALGPLQRLQERFPDIQVVYSTSTEGSWGNRNVEPAVEAAKLTEFYTQRLKIKFPIAIWQSEKKPTEDGGMLPENDGPNFAHYPMAEKPNIYVIDGQGHIRRVYIETITREREAQIATLIEFLQKEASSPASAVVSRR